MVVISERAEQVADGIDWLAGGKEMKGAGGRGLYEV